LKAAGGKHLGTNKGKPIIMTSDFSKETLKARRARNECISIPGRK
jgi:hypothetical protein